MNIALLRGINVGGNAMVSMGELRAFFAALRIRDARTVLQSGNVVFFGDARTAGELESRLESEALKRLGLPTRFFVRSAVEWADVVARNPFPDEATHDPSRLHVMFLKSAPAAPAVKSLQANVIGPEIIRAGKRHLYITYPDGAGRSKLTGALIEKKLGTSGTARNWNTVPKLADLAGAVRTS